MPNQLGINWAALHNLAKRKVIDYTKLKQRELTKKKLRKQNQQAYMDSTRLPNSVLDHFLNNLSNFGIRFAF